MIDAARLEDLRDDVLDGVRRDGEPDTDVAGRAGAEPVSICVLTPMTWPRALRRGPPELPWLIGASVWITWSIVKRFGAVMRRWSALMIPDVAVRSSPNGLPIATTRVADAHDVGVAEGKRSESTRRGLHAEDGEIGGRIGADDFGLDRVAVREAHGDLVRAFDDVVVRDDVAGLVDDEARAQRRLLLAAERVCRAGGRGRDVRGVDANDAGRGALVDLVDAQPIGRCGRKRGRWRCRRLRDDGCAGVEPAEKCNCPDCDDAPENGRGDEGGEGASERHDSPFIAPLP